jgi:hypothetical protein
VACQEGNGNAEEAQAIDLSQSTGEPIHTARKRSLKKLGVMSLDQAISFKDGVYGSRWNLRVLGKNKDALEAAVPKRKKRTRRSDASRGG